jgi:beta-lactamase class D
MAGRILTFCLLILTLAACSPNNITEDSSLKKYFDENHLTGTFGLFDNNKGHFIIYNPVRFSDSTYLPASTFKIINSLIGVETGIIQDSSTVIPWDSVQRRRTECNRDMTMYDAFRISCPPWYQELARRIGKENMQHWLDTLGYGRRYDTFRINNNLDTFWLDNSAKVTADEQLGIVKKLYFDQLPFLNRTQRVVRNMMLWENNANYRLNYKTGWGSTEKNHSLGWIVGWIEENKHPYFFVLQVESTDPDYDLSTVRLKMLKDILKHLGFMQGKK